MWQILAGFVSGVLLAVGSHTFPSLDGLTVLAVTLTAALTVGSLVWTVVLRKMFPRQGGLLLMVAGAVAVGAVYGGWSSLSRYQAWLPETLVGRELMVTGRIVDLPVRHHDRTRFVLQAHGTDAGENRDLGRLSLSWHEGPFLKAGQVWQLCVKLKRPHGFASPGAGDYEAVLLRQRVAATGYVRQCDPGVMGAENRLLRETSQPVVEVVRQRLSHWLEQHLSSHGQALVRTLLLGDSRGLTPEDWLLFRETGTVHLLVISGLHISLMALVGWWLARWLALAGLIPLSRFPLPVVAPLTGLCLALIYGALAGFGLPVQRALVMLTAGIVSVLLGFRLPLRTIYLLALCTVLVLDPLAVTARGFWLSFAAVAALLYVFSYRRGQHGLSGVIVSQIIVATALLPLLAVMQQPVSLLSPLINLFSIPLIGSVLIPVMLVALGLSVVWSTAGIMLLNLCGDLLVGWQMVLGWVANISPTTFLLPVPEGLALWGAVAGVVLLLSPVALGWRWISVLLFLPWLWPADHRPEYGVAELAVLDVGQGLSVVVRTRGHLLVYDTGDRFSPSFTAAGTVLLPYLQWMGVVPGMVVISHNDRDHIGGLNVVRERYPDAVVHTPQPMSEGYCPEGESWAWDGVQFRFLGSGSGLPSRNDQSCVLQVCAGIELESECALLAGDITWRREKQLVAQYGDQLQSRILLVPHHGSRTSSSQLFLDKVKPVWASVSAGYHNRFHHPSGQIKERYNRKAIKLLVTAETGTQRFFLGSNRSPSCFRGQANWWRRLSGYGYKLENCEAVPVKVGDSKSAGRLNSGLW